MNRRRNLIIVIVGLILVIGVAVAASGKHGPTTITAQVATVKLGSYVTRLPETGVVQRPQLQTLPALVAGNISTIAVRPGDHVQAGEVLVVLTNPQLENAAQDAHQAYLSSASHAASTQRTDTSNVVQAEANLESAKFRLNQAISDQKAGAQSGLGYGFSSAQQERADADAAVANADTNLHEAQRIYDADLDLFNNKAISKDALDQQAAKLSEAKVSDDQARTQRNATLAQLGRQTSVLRDSVRAAQDGVRQAQAALDAARANAGSGSPGDVEAARADAAQRLSDDHYAQAQVARLTIRAPFSGVVQTIASETGDSLRQLQPGDAVTVGQALVTVASDSGYVVRARVDEQDIAQVAVGQKAEISGEDLNGKTLAGHIVNIGAVAQKSDDPSNTSRQVITTIALDQSVPYLRDGMSVDIDILTTNRSGVITVPNDAVLSDAKGKYVLTVTPGGRATRTSIVTGASNDAQTIVTSGLHPGDRIVAEHNVAIVPNTLVKAAPTPAPGSSAQPT
jgi:HlyD family secretion protein